MQRVASNESPFAQTSNSSSWGASTSADTTTSPNWMTSSGNGYAFTGAGYVFGFVVPANNQLMSISVGDSSPSQYQCGAIVDTNISATRADGDDQAVSYGNNTIITEVTLYNSGVIPVYSSNSRVNVIRMEL